MCLGRSNILLYIWNTIMGMEEELEPYIETLEVDDKARTYLLGIAKWANILANAGFTTCAIWGITRIIGMTTHSWALWVGAGGGAMYYLISLCAITMLYFPSRMLKRFSRKMTLAIHTMDNDHFNNSFNDLKNVFKFYGTVTILLIVFLFFGLIFIVDNLAGL